MNNLAQRFKSTIKGDLDHFGVRKVSSSSEIDIRSVDTENDILNDDFIRLDRTIEHMVSKVLKMRHFAL